MSSCRRMIAKVAALLRHEDGPTTTEYAVMLALIILVSVAVIAAIGGHMQSIYDCINGAVA